MLQASNEPASPAISLLVFGGDSGPRSCVAAIHAPGDDEGHPFDRILGMGCLI